MTEVALRGRVAMFGKRLEQPQRGSKIAALVGGDAVLERIDIGSAGGLIGSAAAGGQHQPDQQGCEDFAHDNSITDAWTPAGRTAARGLTGSLFGGRSLPPLCDFRQICLHEVSAHHQGVWHSGRRPTEAFLQLNQHSYAARY